MIRTIYLDLDDVCNTLAPCVLNAVGCPIEPDSYDNYPQSFGYAAHLAANHLLGHPQHLLDTQYTWESFWQAIPQTLWATVPRTSFFPWLTETCCSLVGEKNVFLATAPVDTPWCVAGKIEWIQAYCPTWLHRQFFITPHKEQLARPDALLIDDNGKNIIQFVKHRGQGIIVPRPWNVFYGHDPQTFIATSLKQFHFTQENL